jgi:hypothetical protein
VNFGGVSMRVSIFAGSLPSSNDSGELQTVSLERFQ